MFRRVFVVSRRLFSTIEEVPIAKARRVQAETVSKKFLVDEIALEVNLPKSTVEKVVNLFLKNVQRHALDGKSVRLTKFGTFSQKKVAARTARNPTNGEPIEVPAKEKLGFKPSKATEEAAAE